VQPHHRASLARQICRAAAAFALSATTPTFADDYKHITDAAYCAGVVAKNITLNKGQLNVTIPGDGANLLRLHTIVQGAQKLGKVDTQTTNRLFLLGQHDAQLCWDTFTGCLDDALKNSDGDKINACVTLSEPMCKGTRSCG